MSENDIDPIETQEWLEAINSVIEEEGIERALSIPSSSITLFIASSHSWVSIGSISFSLNVNSYMYESILTQSMLIIYKICINYLNM